MKWLEQYKEWAVRENLRAMSAMEFLESLRADAEIEPTDAEREYMLKCPGWKPKPKRQELIFNCFSGGDGWGVALNDLGRNDVLGIEQYLAVGNAIPPLMARAVLSRVIG